MITFKQFLIEGGAATKEYTTERANQADVNAALQFVTKHTGIPLETLKNNLLGSTPHTLAGKKKDSGDIDIAFEIGKYDVDELVGKMLKAVNDEGEYNKGTKVGSFAVPVNGKKVQVDFMFVKDENWAKFGFHSAAESKHKGIVRNFLIINLMKRLFVPGKDFVLHDDQGNEIARVRRGFKMDTGLERLFRLAPMRKDGKGRTAMKSVKPEELEAELKRMGKNIEFSKDSTSITDPDKAAEFMFGKGVKAADVLSAEQVIALIKKRKDHAAIFKDAIVDIQNAKQPVPDEIRQFA